MSRWQLPQGSPATLAVLSVGAAVFAVLQSILSPALPVIQRELGTTQLNVTWVVTAYLLSASVFTPVLGRLGDTLGKKRVLIASMLTLAIGVMISAVSTTIGVMVLGRVIQGAGGAIFPLAFGILRDQLQGRALHRSVGIIGSIGAGGVALGSLLSGIIVDLLGFRWLFWGPLIVLVIAITVMTALPTSPRHPTPVSIAPIITFSLWLTGTLLVTSNGQQWGFTSPITLGTLAAVAVVFVLWLLAEQHSRGPLIDLKLMRTNVMWTTSALAALLAIPLFSLQTFVPQFLQAPESSGYGFGMTVLQTVIVLLPLSVALFVMGFVSHRLIARYGFRRALIGSIAIVVAGCAFLITPHVAIWQVAVASLLSGIGMGAVMTIMPVLVVTGVPTDQTGIAGGINANLRTVGGAIGTALVAAVITSRTNGVPRAVDYQVGFTIFIVAAVLAGLVCFMLKEPKG